MIESLGAILTILIYILLIILLVVGIILGIKLIITIDKVNVVIDEVMDKITSLNNFFGIIDGISTKFSLLTSKITDSALTIVSKIGNKILRKDEDDYE